MRESIPVDVVNNIISFTDQEIRYRYCFVVNKTHYSNILKSLKTVEGRTAKKQRTYTNLDEGDIIAFRPGQAAKIGCFARVTEVRTFPNFREMIDFFSLNACLPNCKTIDEGISIYHSIKNYEKDATNYGVLGIKFELMEFPQKYRKLKT
ncbi:MAG: hypothetical protein CMB64_05220 [Euryarchaeota archaeon]|nr:hypothetical protein [Euryarchaeota archaeon]